jgi:integrase
MARPKLEQPNYRLVRRGIRFYVRWWDGKAWQRVSTGETEQPAARRFLAQFIAGRGTPEPPAQPTIDAVLAGYLADRKDRVASYDTLETCAKPLRRHLGDLEPGHLTRERSRFYAAARRAEGHEVGPSDKRRRKPTSDGTIIRELVMLRAALKWAQRERWFSELPYIEVPSQPQARDRWLTRAEAAHLMDQAKAPHVKLFIALALHTAARAGALFQLTWDQVDLENGRITLGRGRGNKRRAIVPINKALRPYLADARTAATCPHVIEHGSAPVASVKTGFRAACTRAKLPGVTPHVLRHTAATWQIQAGVPLEKVAAYLGNRKEMVERVYGHHSPEWLREGAEALSGPVEQSGASGTENPL